MNAWCLSLVGLLLDIHLDVWTMDCGCWYGILQALSRRMAQSSSLLDCYFYSILLYAPHVSGFVSQLGRQWQCRIARAAFQGRKFPMELALVCRFNHYSVLSGLCRGRSISNARISRRFQQKVSMGNDIRGHHLANAGHWLDSIRYGGHDTWWYCELGGEYLFLYGR